MPEKQSKLSYLSLPPAGTGKGVLVLHAWWGLNDFIKGLCDRLAAEGFVAAAPDLYGGKTAATIPEAEALRSRVKPGVVRDTLVRAAEQLAVHPAVDGSGIGLVGFSLGAYHGLWLAQQPGEPLNAVVVFYGTRGGDYAPSQAAFQGHFAETDPYVAASGRKKMEKSLQTVGRPVEFYDYPGAGHWFFESDRPDAYHAPSALLAWERMLEFLKTHLE